MRDHKKHLLGTLAAIGMLLTAPSIGHASRLLFSETRFKITFTTMTIEGGTPTFRCPTIITGSFHSRVVSKVLGADIGDLERITTTGGGCESVFIGDLAATRPWHLLYTGFTGTLPAISSFGIRIDRAGMLIFGQGEKQGICLYEFTREVSFAGTFGLNEAGVISEFRVDETRRIPIVIPHPESCPEFRTFRGTATEIMSDPILPRVTITLVA